MLLVINSVPHSLPKFPILVAVGCLLRKLEPEVPWGGGEELQVFPKPSMKEHLWLMLPPERTWPQCFPLVSTCPGCGMASWADYT